MFHEDVLKDVPLSVGDNPKLQLLLLMFVLFHMVWNFVLLNIFVGAITSAFEHDRDDAKAVFEDRNSRCMVCSVHVHELERNTLVRAYSHISRQTVLGPFAPCARSGSTNAQFTHHFLTEEGSAIRTSIWRHAARRGRSRATHTTPTLLSW